MSQYELQINEEFDDVEDYKKPDPVPTGTYPVMLTEIEQVKSRTNESCLMCSFALEIIGTAHAGRKIFGRYIVAHEKESVKEIGTRKARALIKASGGKSWNLKELMISPRIHMAEIKLIPAKDGNEAKNEPTGVHTMMSDEAIDRFLRQTQANPKVTAPKQAPVVSKPAVAPKPASVPVAKPSAPSAPKSGFQAKVQSAAPKQPEPEPEPVQAESEQSGDEPMEDAPF